MKRYYFFLKALFFLILIYETTPSASISTPYSSEIDAIIFDCDGVLVDTEYLKFLAWQTALASKNISFVIEEYRPLIGHSSKNILKMLKELKKIEIPDQVIELKDAEYTILQKRGVSPIKEMVRLAKQLAEEKRRLGIKLGLASSAPTEEILQNLKQIDLEDSFDLIISGSDDLENYSDLEGKNKPKPYIYIEAAKRLGVNPAKCLVLEDTAAGVEAAAAAGMIAIAVPNSFTTEQDFSKATAITSSYKDLPFAELLQIK